MCRQSLAHVLREAGERISLDQVMNDQPWISNRLRQSTGYHSPSQERWGDAGTRGWGDTLVSVECEYLHRVSPSPRLRVVHLALDHRVRSEERRVGKGCRSRWATYHQNKNISK